MALEFSWELPLDQPPPASTWAKQPGSWIQLAQAVEYAGLDGLWIPPGTRQADSLGVAAALCAHTRQLQLTVGVASETILPAALAATLQSLQSISNGRARAYLPAPSETRRSFGETLTRDQHHQRLDEYLHILRHLLHHAETPLNYQGDYFQLENAGIAGRALPAPPLLLDAALGDELLARHADFTLVDRIRPNHLTADLRPLQNLASRYRRAPKAACLLGLIMAASEEQAWDKAAERLPQAGTSSPAQSSQVVSLQRHPGRRWEVHPNLLRHPESATTWLVGSPRQVALRLGELRDAGIEHVVLRGAHEVAQVLHFGEQVLPLLVDAGVPNKE